ncbi:MAG TPA: Gfo/Idh/MocA family oxidoreductase [Terriglobales bacterium]|nr:Gfo/Idh/MocA family oxidoreductase [Terriglobales bacterium]
MVGAGAFGRNHARVYHDLQQQGEAELVALVDADSARANAIASQFGARAFASVKDMLREARPQAASVAVPTVHHLAVARELMEAGVDVLIEKPVATSLAEADELIRVAQQGHRVAQVGHLERFNPAVRATVPIITKPMFFEIHRLSVFTPRALDVDVVLDLMIHDIDIVLSFVNSPVKEVRAVGLPILSGKVDIANVRMEFESGCVANLTASRVSTEKVRKVRFFQPQQYISIDYSRQDLLVLTVDPAMVAAAMATGSVAAEALTSLIRPAKPAITLEEPLCAELRSFLEAVRNRTRPVVNLEDGRRALAVALDILSAIREHNRLLRLDSVWVAK